MSTEKYSGEAAQHGPKGLSKEVYQTLQTTQEVKQRPSYFIGINTVLVSYKLLEV